MTAINNHTPEGVTAGAVSCFRATASRNNADNSPREATSRADRGAIYSHSLAPHVASDAAAPISCSQSRGGGTYSEAGDHSPSGPATRGAVPSEPRTYFTPWGFLPVVDVIDTPPEVIEAATIADSLCASAEALQGRAGVTAMRQRAYMARHAQLAAELGAK